MKPEWSYCYHNKMNAKVVKNIQDNYFARGNI